MIKQEIDKTLRQAAIVHKRLSALPPGIELEDFQPEERDLYNNISTRFFSQLNRIAEVKNRFGDQQRQKLFKTMRVCKCIISVCLKHILLLTALPSASRPDR